MAFLVSGITGNTGSVVAETLLAAGKKVRVLLRDANKADAWRARGAEIALGSLTDHVAVAKALSGVEGAYLLTPPAYGAPDVLVAGREIIASVKAALETTSVPHVVWLSSVGAQHTEGTGPIRTAHDAERALSGGRTPITFVRAAYFQENWGSVAAVAKTQGILPSFLAAGRPVAQVATADIGRVAADALIAGPKGPGPRYVELEGPRRYTPEDVAPAFSAALGKPVQLVPVPPEGVVPSLRDVGFSDQLAALYRDMVVGIASGHVDFEGKDIVKGRVTLEETVRKLVG